MIIIGMNRPGIRAGELLEDEVVPGLHAQERELLVLRLVEDLAAVARERGEEQRRQHVALVHVGDPRRGLVAALAHVVVGDGLGRELLAPLAGDRVEAGRDDLAVLVDPELGVAVAHDVRGARSRYGSGTRSCQSRAGSMRWSSTETNQLNDMEAPRQWASRV